MIPAVPLLGEQNLKVIPGWYELTLEQQSCHHCKSVPRRYIWPQQTVTCDDLVFNTALRHNLLKMGVTSLMIVSPERLGTTGH